MKTFPKIRQWRKRSAVSFEGVHNSRIDLWWFISFGGSITVTTENISEKDVNRCDNREKFHGIWGTIAASQLDMFAQSYQGQWKLIRQL